MSWELCCVLVGYPNQSLSIFIFFLLKLVMWWILGWIFDGEYRAIKWGD